MQGFLRDGIKTLSGSIPDFKMEANCDCSKYWDCSKVGGSGGIRSLTQGSWDNGKFNYFACGSGDFG